MAEYGGLVLKGVVIRLFTTSVFVFQVFINGERVENGVKVSFVSYCWSVSCVHILL